MADTVDDLLRQDRVAKILADAVGLQSEMCECIVIYTTPSDKPEGRSHIHRLSSFRNMDRLIRLLEQAKLDELLIERDAEAWGM